MASRLKEAGLPTRRLIDVEDGRKQSYDHTPRDPDAVGGNYGVVCGAGLVGFDIDDYHDRADTSALDDLPATFAVETPHGGEHRYYKAGREAVATINAATDGVNNASLSWGEIHADGKYLVGPGSRITDCDKDHCDECRRHGGAYSITGDRPIAEITPEQVRSVFSAEPGYAASGLQSTLGVHTGQEADTESVSLAEAEDLSAPAPDIESIEDPERRLWESLVRHHEHNEVGTGVKVTRILDRAEELDIDRWVAAEHLVRWVERGRLQKSSAPNRIAPAGADLYGPNEPVEGEQTDLDAYR